MHLNMDISSHRSIMAVPEDHLTAVELCLGAVTGLLSHWLYFIRGSEHHMRAPLYLRLYCVLVVAAYLLEVHFIGRTYTQACLHTVALTCVYCCSLFTSIIVYRSCFHRTRSFPGPKLAGLTKFWHVWQAWNSQNHLVMTALQKEYGDFVRTGPNEITIFHPDALNACNGPGSDCTKANWYDFLKPQIALNTHRDVKEHEARRKLWKPSFVKESLGVYDDILIKYLDRLDKLVGSTKGHPADIVTFVYWWAFDVMGELTLSINFNMLQDEEWHSAVMILRKFMSLLGPCTPVPWLGRLGFSLPGVTRGWNKMLAFCHDQTERRLAIKEKRVDICQGLVEHARHSSDYDASRRCLEGDVIAMIIAGSDTIASTVVYALYHLATEPEYQTAIINEIKALNLIDLHDSQACQNLSVLDAIIKETMRLHPPVVTGGPRDTGPDGLYIAGQFIPPFTTVITPRYTIARLPTAFSNPDTFLPSRWLGDDSIKLHNTKAFAPFGAGKYACIGRALAMRQLKLTLLRLITRYDIRLAPGEQGTEVVTDMRDQFTAVPGRLRLSFYQRTETSSEVPHSATGLGPGFSTREA